MVVIRLSEAFNQYWASNDYNGSYKAVIDAREVLVEEDDST